MRLKINKNKSIIVALITVLISNRKLANTADSFINSDALVIVFRYYSKIGCLPCSCTNEYNLLARLSQNKFAKISLKFLEFGFFFLNFEKL